MKLTMILGLLFWGLSTSPTEAINPFPAYTLINLFSTAMGDVDQKVERFRQRELEAKKLGQKKLIICGSNIQCKTNRPKEKK